MDSNIFVPSCNKPNLLLQYQSDMDVYEIGIDEAGRGPLFGRLYVAAVVLPKVGDFYHKDIKDSKKIKSRKKISTLSEYITQNSLAHSIQYIEHSEIDEINIRQSVFKAAHRCIKDVYHTILLKEPNAKFHILMDGNDFIPYTDFDKNTNRIISIPYDTIESGDNKMMSIASASILAKHSRDTYIEELCLENPILNERYGLNKNKGYGTKQHILGIEKYGISQWHRRTYGRCKHAKYFEI
jgi:ribonuclease HII